MPRLCVLDKPDGLGGQFLGEAEASWLSQVRYARPSGPVK